MLTNNLKLILILPALLLSCTYIATAQTDTLPIEVLGRAEDNLGGELIYKVKEEIRSSNSLVLTIDQDLPRVQLRLQTIDMDIDNNNSATIYSVIWTVIDPTKRNLPVVMNSNMGYVGYQAIDRVARGLVAATRNTIDDLIKSVNN